MTSIKTAKAAFKKAGVEQHHNAKPTFADWMGFKDICDRMTCTELISELSKRKSALSGIKKIAGKLVAYETAAKKAEIGTVDQRTEHIAQLCKRIAGERNPTPIINHLETVMPNSTVARIVTSEAFRNYHMNLDARGAGAITPSRENECRNPLEVLIGKEEIAGELKEKQRLVKRLTMRIRSLRPNQ